MKQSKLFGHTQKQSPKDEVSTNAQLLVRAGFVDKVGAGIYSYLPLGVRVLVKISEHVRNAMNAVGGQELLMPALHPKEYWVATGRWDIFDVLYRLKASEDREYALGPTHEEILTPLASKFISSYRELPLSLYQIQTKFRDEPRAKSGLMRGREFLMKDMYSFHSTLEDLNRYYETVKEAYQKLYNNMGLIAYRTEASGGTFSKYSHEFQVLTSAGEDTIYYCSECHYARNGEIIGELGEEKRCASCKKPLEQGLASEVGNIFNLGTKFSEKFGLTFRNEKGETSPVIMGCYGIGVSRLMGVMVEVFHDDRGIIWPESVAPFRVHLIILGNETDVITKSERLYQVLLQHNVEVLYDDRDVSAGVKLKDADLIGIPVRLVVSEKTGDKVEWKRRNEEKAELISTEECFDRLK